VLRGHRSKVGFGAILQGVRGVKIVGIERIGSPDVVVQSIRDRQGQPVLRCLSVHVFEFFRIGSLNLQGVSSDSSPTIPSEIYASKWSDVKKNDERVFCPFLLADVQYIETIV
jgi:hypothetical protein